MNILKQVLQLIKKPEPERPEIHIETIYPAGYTTPKTKTVTTRRIIKCRKAHDCEDCGKHIFCGSFVCRKESSSWGNTYYDYLCLDCAKKFKRVNTIIYRNQNEYNKNNMLATFRGKE